jgi:hypothetical protein
MKKSFLLVPLIGGFFLIFGGLVGFIVLFSGGGSASSATVGWLAGGDWNANERVLAENFEAYKLVLSDAYSALESEFLPPDLPPDEEWEKYETKTAVVEFSEAQIYEFFTVFQSNLLQNERVDVDKISERITAENLKIFLKESYTQISEKRVKTTKKWLENGGISEIGMTDEEVAAVVSEREKLLESIETAQGEVDRINALIIAKNAVISALENEIKGADEASQKAEKEARLEELKNEILVLIAAKGTVASKEDIYRINALVIEKNGEISQLEAELSAAFDGDKEALLAALKSELETLQNTDLTRAENALSTAKTALEDKRAELVITVTIITEISPKTLETAAGELRLNSSEERQKADALAEIMKELAKYTIAVTETGVSGTVGETAGGDKAAG